MCDEDFYWDDWMSTASLPLDSINNKMAFYMWNNRGVDTCIGSLDCCTLDVRQDRSSLAGCQLSVTQNWVDGSVS